MKLLWMALVLFSGATLAIQAPINARLREAFGSPVMTALFGFLLGSALLAASMLAGAGGKPRFSQLGEGPWWMWLGGAIGAVYVLSAMLAVPRIGAAALVSCAVAGQLLVALLLDRYGWLGVPQAPLTITRLLGAGLLIAGVVLIGRR